jgi:hypothetical protein
MIECGHEHPLDGLRCEQPLGHGGPHTHDDESSGLRSSWCPGGLRTLTTARGGHAWKLDGYDEDGET